jgi:hypothetical protein
LAKAVTVRLLAPALLFGVAAGGWNSQLAAPAPAAALPRPPMGAVPPANGRIFLEAAQQADTLSQASGTPIKSLLSVGRRLNHGDFVWRDEGVAQGPVWVRVDLKSQIISVFRTGHEIGTSVILYGANEKQTPTGVFPILARMRTHKSSIYDAPMPYTLRLTSDGVSVHGSDVRWGAATHGCIGVPVEFARRLFDEVRTGSKVVIVHDTQMTQANL